MNNTHLDLDQNTDNYDAIVFRILIRDIEREAALEDCWDLIWESPVN